MPSPCLSIPSLLLPVPPQNAGPLWGKSFLWKISSGLSNIGELNFPSANWTHSGKVDLGEWMLNPELWVVFNVYPVTELTQLDHQRWNPGVFTSGQEWDYSRNGWESVLHSISLFLVEGELANDVCVFVFMFYAVWCIIPLFCLHALLLYQTCAIPLYIFVLIGWYFLVVVSKRGSHHPMEGMEDLVAEYRESLIEKAGLGLGSSRLHIETGCFLIFLAQHNGAITFWRNLAKTSWMFQPTNHGNPLNFLICKIMIFRFPPFQTITGKPWHAMTRSTSASKWSDVEPATWISNLEQLCSDLEPCGH